ncbi:MULTISPECIES: tRNA lysidine(34) synthetase TilS [Aurantimonas]|uniref:tRNA lysidine(34) synthetase TilS n=1 Tax=Aurantimonas TaxID=182269 RepID=UPI003511F116
MSGGPDSLALILAAIALQGTAALPQTRFHIVTVDHGLRDASAAEARYVASVAARFGLGQETLRWAAPARTGNIAAAARDARYALLANAARRFGATVILTAHHADDQCETHMMARERGAGVVGLAGMRPVRSLAPDLVLARPFLDIAGDRLKASVAAHGLPAVEDPTNDDPASRRVQLRRQIAAGVLDRDALRARIAGYRSERDALEAGLGEAIAAMQAAGELMLPDDGTLRIARDALRRLGDDAAFVLLQRAIAAVGGRGHGPEGAATIRLLDALRGESEAARTLAGVRAVPGATIILMREYGRAGIAALPATGGERVFDGRFVVDAGAGPLHSGARLVAFGDLGRGNPVEKTLPVLVAGDSLVAIPAQLGGKVAAGTLLLAIRSLVGWSLTRDLPPPTGGWTGRHAKPR